MLIVENENISEKLNYFRNSILIVENQTIL